MQQLLPKAHPDNKKGNPVGPASKPAVSWGMPACRAWDQVESSLQDSIGVIMPLSATPRCLSERHAGPGSSHVFAVAATPSSTTLTACCCAAGHHAVPNRQGICAGCSAAWSKQQVYVRGYVYVAVKGTYCPLTVPFVVGPHSSSQQVFACCVCLSSVSCSVIGEHLALTLFGRLVPGCHRVDCCGVCCTVSIVIDAAGHVCTLCMQQPVSFNLSGIQPCT